MHLAPSKIEAINESRVEFVCTCGIRESRAELLQERDFAVDTDCDDERNDNARNEELNQMRVSNVEDSKSGSITSYLPMFAGVCQTSMGSL